MSPILLEEEIPAAPQATAPAADSSFQTSRRSFIAGASGGFLLEFCLPGISRLAKATGTPAPTQVNSYVQIGADSSITALFGGCELGQGASSGLAQILADELQVAWSTVSTVTALPGAISYITGGSSAIRDNYLPVRQAGAAVRMMLVSAAAAYWKVPATQCVANLGLVTHTPTKRTLSYGFLAPLAAKLNPPAKPVLLPASKLRLTGQPLERLDLADKVCGRAIYGIDVRIPGMVYAAVKHGPALGATVARLPQNGGSLTYVNLGTAYAVVADNTFDAFSAVGAGGDFVRAKGPATGRPVALDGGGGGVTWNMPSNAAQIDSTLFAAQAVTLMANGPAIPAETIGNAPGAMTQAKTQLLATYNFPYLAHACMEVLNCTVNLTATTCEIWAPTQAAAWVQGTAATLTGLPLSKITVHTTLLGGGLGRKIEQDYIAQAVQVAMAIKKPVKLTWPREEDFGNDMYRPMAVCRVQAGLDAKNNILAWANRIVTPSILAQRGWISAGAEDGQATEGATALPYNMTNRLVEFVAHPAPVPIGFWRSVGSSFNAYVVESFIDELAHQVGVDPYQYRRQLLAGNPRFLAVLDAAAELGGWNSTPPSGHFRGIAIAEAFGTVVAEVVEISGASATGLKVVSVALAVDCGIVINPDSVEAQMQGGIVHGLGAALWGHITFTNGAASVSNFNDYRLVRMQEMPQVTVKIIPSTNPPTGAGEPGVPPLAPALANAYFRATGIRMRSLPFFASQSHMSDG